MTDFNKPLQELLLDIAADGIVDAKEVAGLRQRLYADGQIDRDEAEFLFALNDAVSGKKNDLGWQALFVEAITKFVLEDEKSPGVVDQAEADWLIRKIESDRQIDATERALLAAIKAKAKSPLPQSLSAKIAAWGV
jgi:hypothetical protein